MGKTGDVTSSPPPPPNIVSTPPPAPVPQPAPPPEAKPVENPEGTFAPTSVTVQDVLTGKYELGLGSKGDAVGMIQQFLGVAHSKVMGPTTAAAIERFKIEQGVTTAKGANPVVGPATMKIFMEAMGTSPKDLTPHARKQMAGLLSIAKANAPGTIGSCYGKVWDYLLAASAKAGYGNGQLIPRGPKIPGDYAAQFGEWLNQGDNARSVGLKKLDVTNPYDAPAGAIVVVGAGSPGTSAHSDHGAKYWNDSGYTVAQANKHPDWPGDVSVATGDGVNFVNDHTDESYGGSHKAWDKAQKAGGAKLIGVYVPI
jgi:hypothetical protein